MTTTPTPRDGEEWRAYRARALAELEEQGEADERVRLAVVEASWARWQPTVGKPMLAANAPAGRIVVYGIIGDRETQSDARSVLAQLDDMEAAEGQVIEVKVNSPGGFAEEGLAIYNALRTHPATIHISVDGLAASAASIIAMAGDIVRMPDNATLMIHNPWTFAMGDGPALRAAADRLDVIKAGTVRVYTRKTRLSAARVSEMMDAETWMTADEAVALAFADEVEGGMPAAAMAARLEAFDLSAFRQVPARVRQALNPSRKEQTMRNEEAPAAAGESVQMQAPAQPAVDVAAERRQAIEAERARVSAIRDLARTGVDATLLQKLEADGTSVEVARETVLSALVEAQGAPEQRHVRIEVGASHDDPATMREPMMQALMHKMTRRGTLDGRAREFRAMTTAEMARAHLAAHGERVNSLRPEEVIRRVFQSSTSDFSNILADASHNVLLNEYAAAPGIFRRVGYEVEVADFKNHRLTLPTSFPQFKKLGEKGEIEIGQLPDSAETVKAETFASAVILSRQALVNDELNAFGGLARAAGRTAARTANKTALTVLTANANMSDGVALFHGTHGNLGTAGAISITTLSEARELLMKQTDQNGDELNLAARYIVTSPEYLTVAEQYTMPGGRLIDGTATGTASDMNVFAGRLEALADAVLSGDDWFVFADPADAPVLVYGYVQGQDGIMSEMYQQRGYDGFVMEVKMDFLAGVADFRGAIMNAGS